MAKAIDVARYLVILAGLEEEPDYLSHLRLQKLLYYVQGWSLAERDEPMFPEKIEAWPNGPVVAALYSTFAPFGKDVIAPENVAGYEAGLTEDEKEFIASVWETYREHSATSLWKKTHSESPWIDARRGYGPADRCDVEITQDAIKSFFKGRLEAMRED